MRMTLKEIAKMAGVSRGMVDRVYHGRGYVNEEKAEKIKALLVKYDYTPNKMARALSISQKTRKIAIILSSVGNEYFDEVIRGIEDAAVEYDRYGLKIIKRYLKGFDPDEQLSIIDELEEEKPDAFILTPANDPRLASRIDSLSDKGIPVVTVNTDIDGCSSNKYIGCDYTRSGEMAGGMLALLSGGEKTDIAVIQGSKNVKGHNERYEGFMSVLSGHPEIKLVADEICGDDEDEAYIKTVKILDSCDPDHIYVAAGGLAGVMKAIQEKRSRAKVIANDLTHSARIGLESGVILVSIFQEPYKQGYSSVKSVFEKIYHNVSLKDTGERIDLKYITKYNMPLQ